MKTKQEIEQYIQESQYDKDIVQVVILEVLLDIRELLKDKTI